jgi:GT2 family glycosyltransferase
LIQDNIQPVRCSVVIVTYNNHHEIEACLHSALRSLGPQDELIVVDNASSDGTAELISAAFPQITLVRAGNNLGFGGANNLGVRHARGEYLAFLNPDTTVESGWLNALLDVLQAEPQVGMVTSRILLMNDPERVNTCGNDVHISGLTLCRGLGRPRHEYDTLAEVAAVSGAAFAMRRALFETLGGFDESYFLYLEDTDLSLRARLAGWRILYAPDSIVYHDYRLTFGPHKTYYEERNRYWMLLKLLRARTLLALLPALLLAEVVTWGFVLLRERRNWRNKLRAYAAIVMRWPELQASRRQTQALRRVSDWQLLSPAAYRLGYEQTGGGLIPRLAHWLFDPFFWLARGFSQGAGRLLCA